MPVHPEAAPISFARKSPTSNAAKAPVGLHPMNIGPGNEAFIELNLTLLVRLPTLQPTDLATVTGETVHVGDDPPVIVRT
jgi:hypothetical protein